MWNLFLDAPDKMKEVKTYGTSKIGFKPLGDFFLVLQYENYVEVLEQ